MRVGFEGVEQGLRGLGEQHAFAPACGHGGRGGERGREMVTGRRKKGTGGCRLEGMCVGYRVCVRRSFSLSCVSLPSLLQPRSWHHTRPSSPLCDAGNPTDTARVILHCICLACRRPVTLSCVGRDLFGGNTALGSLADCDLLFAADSGYPP